VDDDLVTRECYHTVGRYGVKIAKDEPYLRLLLVLSLSRINYLPCKASIACPAYAVPKFHTLLREGLHIVSSCSHLNVRNDFRTTPSCQSVDQLQGTLISSTCGFGLALATAWSGSRVTEHRADHLRTYLAVPLTNSHRLVTTKAQFALRISITQPLNPPSNQSHQ